MFAWFAGPRFMLTGLPPEMTLSNQREGRDVITGAGIMTIVFDLLAVWGLFFK